MNNKFYMDWDLNYFITSFIILIILLSHWFYREENIQERYVYFHNAIVCKTII